MHIGAEGCAGDKALTLGTALKSLRSGQQIMRGKRGLEPQDVRLAFRDPFIRRRLAALRPEQRAMAFAEWEAEQAAKRKGKPIQAERLYTLADLEEAERWARETPGSGDNPSKHRGRIKTARLMEGIIRAQLVKRGMIKG